MSKPLSFLLKREASARRISYLTASSCHALGFTPRPLLPEILPGRVWAWHGYRSGDISVQHRTLPKVSLDPQAPRWPGHDFLRATLETSALPSQFSFLPFPLHRCQISTTVWCSQPKLLSLPLIPHRYFLPPIFDISLSVLVSPS